MNAKRYLRGMLGQGWYNFTECLAWAILYRKMPEELEYCHKVAYGPKKREWINTISRKDLAGQKKPLFVYIHGGGWVSGMTDMRNTYIMNWAKKGFFCAGYTGAVKPPVRRTGNRKSGPEETGIYAAEPPSRRNSFPGWGRQLIGYIIRSVPDPVRIPLSWSGSWQDRSERC